jgi:U5 small nuclear ribonucleoprotein component
MIFMTSTCFSFYCAKSLSSAYIAFQCRFGNFIGEAVESDEEDQRSETGADAYVDYDDASVAGHEGGDQQLMELDGMLSFIGRLGKGGTNADGRTDEGPSNAVVLHEGQIQF